MKKFIALAPIIILLCSIRLQAQLTINTIAGNGTAAYGGDGGPATSSVIDNPYGVAADAAGNVYFTDYANNRIRKIDTFGIITTVAGTGFASYSGDGPATAAEIYAPRGIATDAAGNVYFSDYANNRIRKISTTGIITTVAGNGTPGFSGDGGPATAAEVNFAWGICLDAAGNLYIADQINCRIRKVNTAGIISTIGGTGIAFFSGDGGPAVSAGIQYPMGVASDAAGNLYIADEGDCRIRKINTAGTISTVGGNGFGGFTGDGGPATSAKLYYPQGIALDTAGNIYIADLGNNRIREINTSGIINTITGNGTAGYSGDGGPPILAEINQSTGVAADLLGNIYVADNDNNRIRIMHTVSHAPYFTKGHHQYLSFCPTELVNIDSLLTVFDVDTGQTETWSVVLPPSHGTIAGNYTITSTGDTLLPSGLVYVPIPGYLGADSLKEQVTDGTYSDTTTIYITILTLPDPGTITGIDSLCPGDTLTFADTAAGGTWSSSTTAAAVSSTGLVTGISSGLTTIQYTVTNPCGTTYASFPLLISSNCHTGVNTLSTNGNDRLQIYPNPSEGTFTIGLPDGNTQDFRLTITNLLGEKIKDFAAGAETTISLQLNVPAGIYFVTATTSSGRWVNKLVIQN